MRKQVQRLYSQLIEQKRHKFPPKGVGIHSCKDHGVYVILQGKSVLHVGKTNSAQSGIDQRLSNHRSGKSSFAKRYIKGELELQPRQFLAEHCEYCFLPVADAQLRTYLEAFAIGSLCPKHIGTGSKSA